LILRKKFDIIQGESFSPEANAVLPIKNKNYLLRTANGTQEFFFNKNKKSV
jgi:hypothetical protein